jgi:ketosteroid isomerase-like protein
MVRATIVAAATLAAVTAAAAPPEDGSSASATSAAVIAADRAFGAATAARGLDGWLAYFADEATILPPGEPAVTGLAAIRAYYARVAFDPRGLRWEPQAAVAAAAGDLAYSFGRWEITGGASPAHGKYVTIWKRSGDGSWKVVLDVGNSDPPAHRETNSPAPQYTGQKRSAHT